MQLPPSPLLSTIVKHYLVIEGENSTQLNYRLLSDGNPGIVFRFKESLLQYNTGYKTYQPQSNSFVYGQITHYNDVISTGQLGMLVVVLHPHALHAFLHTAAYELNNDTIMLTDLFGQDVKALEEQVLSASNIHGAISAVERFFIKKLSDINEPDQVIEAALQIINQHKGMITIENLLKTVPVTERQLERKFKEYIGITPKKFVDTVKFQNFLKNLQKYSPGKNITGLCYECGYYDQAHLNNYFKKNTGITPLQYKANHNLPALNFIPVH
ncbi:DUF6597 domain-containing transcriptional factor [Chitinophagaceae bacterium LWZ2-11]